MNFPIPLMFFRILLPTLFLSTAVLAEPVIRSAGVLANSGASGQDLVRLGSGGRAHPGGPPLRGIVVDDSGFLWAFAGPQQVNRYSADGRMIASLKLPTAPKAEAGAQTLAIAGNRLVLLRNGQIWTRPADAPDSEDFSPTGIEAKAMALTALGTRLAFISTEGKIAVLDVPTGGVESLQQLPEDIRKESITLLPDGRFLVDGVLFINPDGSTSQIKLSSPVSQWLNGALYSFRWHTTVDRFNAEGGPNPGVVLGGSSGSFIGSLPQDGEIHLPAGLAHLGGQRYAVVGNLGIIHLLDWSESSQSFSPVRRIGAAHKASGLAVDGQGRVWWNVGYWEWSDPPAALPRNAVHMTDLDGWQVAMLDSGAMCALTAQGKDATLLSNTFHATAKRRNNKISEVAKSLPTAPTGAIATSNPGEVLFVDAAGKGCALLVNSDGTFRSDAGPIELKTSSAHPAITSLGITPGGDLLAAEGNAVVRFTREGGTFTEAERFTSSGDSGESLGPGIYLATQGSNLWISDPANNRVIHVHMKDGEFSRPTAFAGDPEVGTLDTPTRIATSGSKAVVYDQGNQRLVRLEVVNP